MRLPFRIKVKVNSTPLFPHSPSVQTCLHGPPGHHSFLSISCWTTKYQRERNQRSKRSKHSLWDSLKVWDSTPPLMYLVICENRYKVHPLLSGTFERSVDKMFWRIIFVCDGSETSKELLTQEQGERLQSTRVNILAGTDLQKQCPQRAALGSTTMLCWHEPGSAVHCGPEWPQWPPR